MNSIYGFITINTLFYTSSININYLSQEGVVKVQIIIKVSLLAKTMVSVSTTHNVNLGLFCHFHDRS